MSETESNNLQQLLNLRRWLFGILKGVDGLIVYSFCQNQKGDDYREISVIRIMKYIHWGDLFNDIISSACNYCQSP